MFRLTREVRFAVDAAGDADASSANNHAGAPPLRGVGQFFSLEITLQGELDPASSYLRNIKEIDQAARRLAVPLVADCVAPAFRGGRCDLPRLMPTLFDRLQPAWPGATLEAIRLNLSPFLSLGAQRMEHSMSVRLSQRFEFSASHRLCNPKLSDEENRGIYGKCSNPHGHGHNYEVEVTLAGPADAVNGVLVKPAEFERVVMQMVIDRFDHKNLNVEVAEFENLIPSVENISRVIYRLLRPRFDAMAVSLAAVKVWETPKTWCEYSE